MIPHLQRVVDAMTDVPAGVAHTDYLAAILEGTRRRPEVAALVLDAVTIAYERAADAVSPAHRNHAPAAPITSSYIDTPLRQIQHEVRRAIDLGATPRAVLDRVANGLTGRVNGRVERAAAAAMTTAFDDTVGPDRSRKVPGLRDKFRTWHCRDLDHARCKGGSTLRRRGWVRCACTCHRPDPS